MNFKVVYEIVVDADNSIAAAFIAEQEILNLTERPSFVVIDEKGRAALIDLEQAKHIDNIPTGSLKFVCPKCKGNRLECCEDGPYSSEVVHIGEDGDFDYGMIQADGSVDRFQCFNCGFVLAEINDVMEVVDWIKENCLQK